MRRLRAPDGCPWDREQTYASLKPFLLEEAYEVLEAIDAQQPEAHCEELGDLLFQIVFQAQIASERGEFGFAEVVDAIARKLIRRHPHVFADAKVNSAAQVADNWVRIKNAEKANRGEPPESVLEGVPQALPALLAAERLSDRAAQTGFDWENAHQVFQKIREEVDELAQAETTANPEQRKRELAWEIGDLLFAITNLARHLDLSAETALVSANRRFRRRFQTVERLARERGLVLRDASLDTLEALWQEAKKLTD